MEQERMSGMKYLLIACQMLKDELGGILQDRLLLGHDSYKTVYLPAALHEKPALLRQSIEKALSFAGDYETVLLAYGYCGGALCGLRCQRKLVMFRYDDCISLLLRSNDKAKGCFYLTPAWLSGQRNFFTQVEHLTQKYGKEKAGCLLREMVGNYDRLCFIEQKVGQAQAYQDLLQQLSHLLHLPITTCCGSALALEKLVAGNWDEEFLIFRPGQPLKYNIG
jgi:hypothetical protein